MINKDNTPHEVIQQLLDELTRIRNFASAVDREVQGELTQSEYVKLKPHPADIPNELDDVHREVSNWLLRNGLDAVPRRGDLSRAPGLPEERLAPRKKTVACKPGMLGNQS